MAHEHKNLDKFHYSKSSREIASDLVGVGLFSDMLHGRMRSTVESKELGLRRTSGRLGRGPAHLARSRY